MPPSTALIVRFPGETPSNLETVGGKGWSLLRLSEAGLPVPPGAILTTDFFAPWFDRVRASEAWRELVSASPERWAALCATLRRSCDELALTEPQAAALDTLRAESPRLVAVRSSSPDEDLDAASFAGGYVTRLGVRPEDLEDAVRDCFASSLDERVLVYKRERGFDPFAPRLAVVVQQQLDSRAAGVAFSLDPLTNDYDHAVVDANHGLGESVVAGLVTPDHWVVDKVSRQVVEETLGAKQRSIVLDPDGGTIERGEGVAGPSLDHDRLVELVELVCRVEALYDRPMDVEWALTGEGLHLLQARPITTHVPLPDELLTAPGERRRVYSDIALSSGFTINAPISPLGLDWMRESVGALAERFLGRLDLELREDEGFWIFAGCRMYQDLSNLFWLTSAEQMAKSSVGTDPLMAEILGALDTERYRSSRRPRWAGWRMARVLPRLLWRGGGLVRRVLGILVAPARAERRYRRETAAFERELADQVDLSLPLDAFRRRLTGPTMGYLFDVTMPALGAGLAAVELAWRLAGAHRSEATQALAESLRSGYPGNVVVEMGIALRRLARRFDPADLDDLDALAERVERRELPADLLAEWDAFLARYGHRGPLEMDVARPRYADDPRLALGQMASMRGDGDDALDPEAAHRRLVDERRAAVDILSRRVAWWRRLLLRHLHRVIERFAGTRDTPKHHNLLLHQAIRRRVLVEGERLVEAGRLDVAADVFHLGFDDLDRAASEPGLDLRHLGEERMRFYRRLDVQVNRFPPVIDSRGRILRPPPREEAPGELRGQGLSAGVVRGPVKVLRTPDEKPVERGDILVAYATDPGWTPLFANAAAVVLEVGGALQHGALVAREYGKPCVAGIDRLLDRLEDGEVVEVDGAAGIVRRLADDADDAQPTNL